MNNTFDRAITDKLVELIYGNDVPKVEDIDSSYKKCFVKRLENRRDLHEQR